MIEFIISWTVDTYHERAMINKHLPSPLSKYREVINNQVRIPLPAPVLLTENEKKEVEYDSLNHGSGQIITKGITRSYIQYNSQDLHNLRGIWNVNSVEYAIDPRDIRVIYVIHPRTGKIIEAHPAGGWGAEYIAKHIDHPLSASQWNAIEKGEG